MMNWTWTKERDHQWGADYVGRCEGEAGWLRVRWCWDEKHSTHLCWVGDVCVVEPAHGNILLTDLQVLAEERWQGHQAKLNV